MESTWEGDWRSVGDYRAATLEGLDPVWIMGSPQLCRQSLPYPCLPISIDSSLPCKTGTELHVTEWKDCLDTQMRIQWSSHCLLLWRNADSQQGQLWGSFASRHSWSYEDGGCWAQRIALGNRKWSYQHETCIREFNRSLIFTGYQTMYTWVNILDLSPMTRPLIKQA